MVKGERRRKLVEAARGLLARQPLARLTVEAAAEIAELPPGVALKLYPDTAALALAVVEDALGRLFAPPEPALDPDSDAAGRLQAHLQAIAKTARGERHGWRAVVRALTEPDEPAMRHKAAAAYRAAAAPLVDLLREGQAAGLVRRSIEPEAAVDELLCGLLGAVLLGGELRFDCFWAGLLKTDV